MCSTSILHESEIQRARAQRLFDHDGWVYLAIDVGLRGGYLIMSSIPIGEISPRCPIDRVGDVGESEDVRTESRLPS